MNGRLKLRGILPLAAITVMAVTPAGAQERPWYLGVDVGIGQAEGLSQSASGIRTPTRCDPWLYAGTGFQAPSNAGCLPEEGRWWWSDLTPGIGFPGGLRVGRAFDRFRVEAEVLHRHHGGDRTLVSAGGQDIARPGKDSQWNPLAPPSAGIADFRATQAFLNASWYERKRALACCRRRSASRERHIEGPAWPSSCQVDPAACALDVQESGEAGGGAE